MLQTLSIYPVVKYQTAKGSVYYLDDQQRTQRNKSFHQEHGVNDVGWKRASSKTVYVTLELAKEIAPKIFGSFWLCFHENKLVLVSKLNGEITPLKRVEYSNIPKVDLCPIEFWDFEDLGHNVLYPHKLHVGNNIISVKKTI